MLALVNHHKDVANFILKGGPACVSYGKEIIDWALEKNLILFFQVIMPIHSCINELVSMERCIAVAMIPDGLTHRCLAR